MKKSHLHGTKINKAKKGLKSTVKSSKNICKKRKMEIDSDAQTEEDRPKKKHKDEKKHKGADKRKSSSKSEKSGGQKKLKNKEKSNRDQHSGKNTEDYQKQQIPNHLQDFEESKKYNLRSSRNVRTTFSNIEEKSAQKNNNTVKIDESCEIKRFRNFLFSEAKEHLVVGKFKALENHPLHSYLEANIYCHDFKSLLPGSWIIGELIDAAIVTLQTTWPRTVALPLWFTSTIFGDKYYVWRPLRRYSKEIMEKLYKSENCEVLLFPYTSSGHYCIFVVNMKDKYTYHLDPFTSEDNERSLRAKRLFDEFF